MTFKECMNRPITMKWWQFCVITYVTGFGCAAMVPVAHWLFRP